MEKPCNGCMRKICNIECCDSYQMYVEEVAMLKNIVSENEYDKLPDQCQYNYWYCEKCQRYVLRSYSRLCDCVRRNENE